MENEFSVSMCVYGGDNAEQFGAAVGSVIRQTLPPSEIVLAVDGPVPAETEEIIRKYERAAADASISFQVVRLEKNMGHGEARRASFDRCRNSLIALMDADDLSVPDRFEKQIRYFSEHPDVSAVGGNITEFISAPDPEDISVKAGNRTVPENDREIKEYMKKRCPMNQVTVMFRKEDVAEAGGYIDWYCEEDYYLWIRLALAGRKFGNLPCNLVHVRVGKEMYRRRGGWKYFKSEARLQKYMLSRRMIGFPRYLLNVGERFILQVLLPDGARGWLFRKLARE